MNYPQWLAEILDPIFNAGLDYATSDDFKELSDDERDQLYIRYKRNVIKKAAQAIQAQFEQATEPIPKAENKPGEYPADDEYNNGFNEGAADMRAEARKRWMDKP